MQRIIIASLIVAASGSLAFADATSDAAFVKSASGGNAFEIEEASLALKQASDAGVKEFAHMMTADHTKAEKKLEDAASTANAKPDVTLDEAHHAKVEALRGKTGAAFDSIYKADQVQAHEETAALLKAYQKDGQNAALKAWAAETLPTVREHLDHAKALPGQ